MLVESYSLADLVEITGAKRRSLQLWADAGVIQAERATERAGTGVHRRFSRQEAIIACLVQPFAARQMAIGHLQIIAKTIRVGVERSPKRFESAIGGSGTTILSFQSWMEPNGEWRYIAGWRTDFLNTEFPESMMTAIRLETYLARLK